MKSQEPPEEPSKTYARSGVDIDLGNRLKAGLPQLQESTRRPEVIDHVGSFNGLFRLPPGRFRRPVLVSSMDGVGTKLKVAFAVGRHGTIGEDLVNHCVNDIAVSGAEPLFFLDYLGTGILKPDVYEAIVSGIAQGCRHNGCSLIGGETAQMPGFYRTGEYDLNGTIVGAVEEEAILDGSDIRPGDRLIGLASNGLHTNGYTLARKILLEDSSWELDHRPESWDHSLADELLRVHRSYLRPIRELLPRFNAPGAPRKIKGFAHITGGGFRDNVPRILPPGTAARITKAGWPIPPVFQLIQRLGGVSETEMYEVFNMGVGLVAVVAAELVDEVLATLDSLEEPGYRIGEIVAGQGDCRLR